MKAKRTYICKHNDNELEFDTMGAMCKHFGFSRSTVKYIIKEGRNAFKIKGVSIEVINKDNI